MQPALTKVRRSMSQSLIQKSSACQDRSFKTADQITIAAIFLQLTLIDCARKW